MKNISQYKEIEPETQEPSELVNYLPTEGENVKWQVILFREIYMFI